ncbi:heat stress transcription factor B-2a-like [Typha angustifolia]|uniref:heat stress transcription factor B-2a-like n=1 Tax=Typha angustifolia TaxID=59011 RepID=UPI003C2E00F3
MPPEGPPQDAAVPAAFLTKTYEMVDDPAVDNVISWNEDGSGFVIWQTVEFVRDLLPTNFRHSNFTSFLRQLYTYGFKKVSPDRWEFANELFRHGQKRLLIDIRRRKNSPAALEHVLSAAGLVEENERLRRENADLTREVRRVKKYLDDVALLMSTYSFRHHTATSIKAVGGSGEGSSSEEEVSTRLFGVPIAVRDKSDSRGDMR